MKKALFIFLMFLLTGCTYEGQALTDYLEDPRAIIKDPHFAEYQKNRDELEGQYLRKDITYAEYVEKMDELDNDYTKEVQERNAILSQ